MGLEDSSQRSTLERQLRQSLQVRAVQRLIDVTCHDFNNRLGLIAIKLELTNRSINKEVVKEHIACALDEIEHCSTLIKRLLSFTDKQTQEPQMVDVGAVVSGMVDLVRAASPSTFITHEHSAPGGLLAEVNLALLEDILLRVLISARDALPEGAALATSCSTIWKSESDGEYLPGHYVAIAVTECDLEMTDGGISPTSAPHCLAKTENQESGFDMNAEYEFAKHTGGTIQLECRPGRQTRVNLYLPAAEHGPRMSL